MANGNSKKLAKMASKAALWRKRRYRMALANNNRKHRRKLNESLKENISGQQLRHRFSQCENISMAKYDIFGARRNGVASKKNRENQPK